MWQSTGLSRGGRAAELRCREGRSRLWQPHPGGHWVAGAGFMSIPLLRQAEEGRRDAGAPFVLHLFPCTESLCLCLPMSSMPSGCSKTKLPLAVPGLDSWEEPGKVLRSRGVLRVNTVWESISCLEGTSEKLPAKLRRMLALRARAPRWALTWGGCQRWGC